MTSNNKTMWMVRAGEAGWRFDEFERESIVSIGWDEMGDLTALQGRDAFMRQVEISYPKAKPSTYPSSAGQVFRFVREIKVGDSVLTYSPPQRSYLVGVVEGAYEYAPTASAEQPNQRKVRWIGRVMRDNLSVATRNSLGAISTLFMVPVEAAAEIERLLSGAAQAVVSTPAAPDAEDQVDDLYKDIQGKAFEFIKDKVSQLDWEDMQELVAGLLRAMGYKTRISPSGSDRGKDIVASPDGLGFEDPRIVVEVKHRTAAMGSQEIRSFLGGRHDNDKGLYVSTGGFTKDARYEAERARIPVTLMDLDDLVKALLEQYERMDIDMQRLIPMRKLYWPA
ncbi:restriction system protein [Paucibacter oligotrophus]|uniref:Restriction system protein n=1 Tax=Roseateles oligotrophus TaxID=1769250 RepID=A0A840L2K0_9BURK|nr:restriction endonuclease [Roseateles oligotrophus]MBB4842470.1 restriction system protein [Roseateles oligotrophus]